MGITQCRTDPATSGERRASRREAELFGEEIANFDRERDVQNRLRYLAADRLPRTGMREQGHDQQRR